MKSITFLIQYGILFLSLAAYGQGSFLYDQQSATQPIGTFAGSIQDNQPMGQSFTPTLASVGFVQFEFLDFYRGNRIGATVYVNLWSGSIGTGTLLGSTAPVSMPDNFHFEVTNFLFSTPISVTPGTTYYIQPVVQSGDSDWCIVADYFNYAGGIAYFRGAPSVNNLDLWFREGIVIPEPPAVSLLLLGGPTFLWFVNRRRKS
jgi:hypothetical protein